MTEKRKIYWVSTQELNMMFHSARECELWCPHCNEGHTYPFSNGEVLDITTSYIEVMCPHCKEIFDVSWEGDPDFSRDEEDFLPF